MKIILHHIPPYCNFTKDAFRRSFQNQVHKKIGLVTGILFCLVSIFSAQCDTEVSGIFTYCNSFDNGIAVTGYFVGFRVVDKTGDTLNVVDLDGHAATNHGKHVDNIGTLEPSNTTNTPLRISGVGADSIEYWYFGPYANGTTFNIALIDPQGNCDTIFVASGTYNCADNMPYADPNACAPPGSGSPVPLYYLDFSNEAFELGHEDDGSFVANKFYIMNRTREQTCCDVGGASVRCMEMIITLSEDDFGLAIDDEGSGNTAGKLYADSLNGFTCTGNTNTTYPFQQGGGQSNDTPLCFNGITARDFIVLSCKSGGNPTFLTIGSLSRIIVPSIVTSGNCDATINIYNATDVDWSSPDDPNLDNLISCTGDSLHCMFRYNHDVFGDITDCIDTFTYIIGGHSTAGACLPANTILYDTAYVIVLPPMSVELTQQCNASMDSTILTATIHTTALNCPYHLEWSTGDTTTSITVPISDLEYYVTLTRLDFPLNSQSCLIASDTIVAVGDLTVTCPVFQNPVSSCFSPLPAPDLNLIEVSGCNTGYLKYVHTRSNGRPGCPNDTLIFTRYYIVDFDGDTISTSYDRDTCIQRFKFVDSTPPSITCPPDITIACSASTLPANTGMATSIDNCDLTPTITFTNSTVAGTCPTVNVITRTWKATDDCGNTSVCVQKITTKDLVAPHVVCPPNITIQCGASTAPAQTGNATATDNCSTPAITFTNSITPGSCTQSYIITRRWIAADNCLNRDTCYQLITVVDSNPPAVTCPPNITVVYPGSTLPAQTGNPVVTDCDPSPSINYTDNVIPSSCAQNGYVLRQWVAVDHCNNQTSCTQRIDIDDRGSICGSVKDENGQGIASVQVRLFADLNANQVFDSGDTLVASTLTNTGGLYCINGRRPCQYILVETTPTGTTNQSDYDHTPDPDGDDSSDGPDGQIPVTLTQGENDGANDFVNVLCPTAIPTIPNDSLCTGSSIVFQINSPVPNLTYSWNFGSGSSPSTGSGPGPHVVNYDTTSQNQANGVNVILTVNKTGCTPVSGTYTHLDIMPSPDATINTSTSPLCYYTTKVFSPLASEIPGATYTWTFGVGAVPPNATGYGPHNVYYTSAGTKTVKLVIDPNLDGVCSDSSTISFVITSCPAQVLGYVLSTANTPISNVTLKLFADADTNGVADNAVAIRTVSTNTSGLYAMASVTPGNYVIIQTQPAGWSSANDYDVSDDGDVVMNVNSLDNLIPVTLLTNEVDSMNSFIEAAMPGTIGGAVFVDLDEDEAHDAGEGLNGVTIKLLPDANNDGIADSSEPTATQTTNASGGYSFTNLQIGGYVLVETNLLHYISVKDLDATNDGDIVANTNQTNDTIPVTLLNNEADTNNYFIDKQECPLLVINTNDSGFGSLRYNLDCARSGDTINFDQTLSGQTININSDALVVTKDLVIRSTIVPTITVLSSTTGLFTIPANVIAEFRDINIISGNASGAMGAAFDNGGMLTLHNLHISKNPAFPAVQYLIRNLPGSLLIFSGSTTMDQ